jgi:hypothetical protein
MLLQKSLKVPIKKSNIKMLFGLTILSIVSVTIGAPQTPAPKVNTNATETLAVHGNSTACMGMGMGITYECLRMNAFADGNRRTAVG